MMHQHPPIKPIDDETLWGSPEKPKLDPSDAA